MTHSKALLFLFMILLSGCGHFELKRDYEQANLFFSQGNHGASLEKYAEIMGKYPSESDRALFEMGIVHVHPKNEHNDYAKAAACFQNIISGYPGSGYRQDSEMMVFYIDTALKKDEIIRAQQERIGTLQQEVEKRDVEIRSLQEKMGALDQKISALVLKNGSADKILVEKKERRLTLLSKGEVLKTYKIALGGNPSGPKERQGDNKTPEGIYFIDSRNRDSRYHLSLHISYPNESDEKRAKDLGVAPGGDIMIHGIKNGFSWMGDLHTERDWTQGCIAVTDEEIEEIDRLAPNGTTVEIQP